MVSVSIENAILTKENRGKMYRERMKGLSEGDAWGGKDEKMNNETVHSREKQKIGGCWRGLGMRL